MLRILSVVTVVLCSLVLGVSALLASPEEAVSKRKALMKTVGGSIGLSVKMAKGAIPFDAQKAQAALEKMAKSAEAFPALLLKGTDSTTMKSSEASPKIWENLDDFKAKSAALATAARKSASAASQGRGAFAKTLKALGGTCASCHKAYRVKKQK